MFGYWQPFVWYKRLWCKLTGQEYRGVYIKGIMDAVMSKEGCVRIKWEQENQPTAGNFRIDLSEEYS